MKYDIITVGGITEDIMFYTDDMQVIKNKQRFGSKTLFAFEVGDKIISDKKVVYTGGGGANSAISLARLGLKTGIIAAVGDDTASTELTARLKKEKVNLHCVQQIKKSWSGLSLVITGGSKSEHVIFTHRAANEKLNLSLNECLALNSKWFYLTSLSGPNWQHNLDVIFKTALNNKIKVAWNPGSTQLKSGYKK